jgi:CDP-6-deoxy-D-xylo-4-hexulose-3-dehydrase
MLNYLQRKFIEFRLRSTKSSSNYWYPLAVPNYGSEEIIESLDSLINRQTTMGLKTLEFEKEFSKIFNNYEAIMVNSGSSADLLIAFALNSKSGGPLHDGDEILVPAVTWPTQVWSLLMAGFKVRLVDVDVKTYNVDLTDLRNKISKNTKAIFTVHLLGNTSNLDELDSICKDFNLILLEDCCESLGTKWNSKPVGTFGLASSFSFFFSHHITTMEGGMIVTKDKDFADRCRLLRAHGWSRYKPGYQDLPDERYKFNSWGFNVRPTEIQASFGIHQIKKLDHFQSERKLNSELLFKLFLNYEEFLEIITIEPQTTCSWFAFPIRVKSNLYFDKTDLCNHLDKYGIETRPIVVGNLANQIAVQNFTNIHISQLIGAEVVDKDCFYIGIHPNYDEKKMIKISRIIDEYIRQFSR